MKHSTKNNRIIVKSEDIYREWQIWKNSADEVKDRTITDKLGFYIMELARKVSYSAQYRGYGEDFKQDMIGDAYLKVVNNLKNMKEEYKDSFYSYVVLAIHSSFKATLAKHYRQLDIKTKMLELARAKMIGA